MDYVTNTRLSVGFDLHIFVFAFLLVLVVGLFLSIRSIFCLSYANRGGKVRRRKGGKSSRKTSSSASGCASGGEGNNPPPKDDDWSLAIKVGLAFVCILFVALATKEVVESVDPDDWDRIIHAIERKANEATDEYFRRSGGVRGNSNRGNRGR